MLLDNKPNRPSKFRTKNWVEINDDARGTYNTNSQIKFKTTVLKSSLYDYSNAYILVKSTKSVTNSAAVEADANNADIKVFFKNCSRLTDCINEKNNNQLDNAKNP